MEPLLAVLAAALSALLFYEAVIANNILEQLGLIGIFFAAFLSNLTVIGRDLFIPLFLSITALYNPLLLGASAGWGGALGLVTTYYGGKGIAEALEGNNSGNKVSEWIRRYGLLAIFIFAATPLPDTPIILLAGSSRLSLPKILLVEGAGKTLWYTLGALLGGILFRSISDIVGSLVTEAIIVAASIIFSVLASWRKGREAIFRRVKKSLS
jgi:membrane protein YqaA with SNARE-associated domain